MSIKVDQTITMTIKGTTLELTTEEATELLQQLKLCIGVNEPPQVPYIIDNKPWNPNTPYYTTLPIITCIVGTGKVVS
ncbi:MAG: hypothetical protein GY760_24730 [Deltaproteobacteria bacterium]|nr:hypothetical protein [Deltaproteobacteria bacterium]